MTPVPNAFGRVPMYEVIDGQQRSTTLHLLLLALRHAAQDSGQMHLAQMLAPLVRNPGPYLVDANDPTWRDLVTNAIDPGAADD